MPQDEEEITRHAFTFYDSNFDGKLTYKELEDACRAIGKLFTDEELKSAISNISKTDDLIKILCYLKRDFATSKDNILEAFKTFDKHGSGFVNGSDLRHALTTVGNRLTDEEVNSILVEMDTNNDGHINYQLFVDDVFAKYKI